MQTPNASVVLAEFESFLRSWDASPNTIRVRMIVVGARMRAWGGVAGFTPDNVRAWFSESSFSRATRTTYYAHLNSFAEFLVVAGYIDDNPMTQVRKPATHSSQPRPLAQSEVDRVLEKCEGRMRDWILLALRAGLRVHEIAKIRGEDVQPEGLRVKGKGGVDVTLPTHPDLWEMAQRYPRVGFWFPGHDEGHLNSETITAAVTRFFKSLGIKGSIHRCRHVYATSLLRSGVNIRQVQKLMRHGSLQTTALYTAVDEDELREAINRLPSLN